MYQEIENTPGINAYEKFDNLNTFYQLRYHLNDLTDKINGDGHYYSLFMSPYLFEASRMLTMEEGCKNKVMLDMCYILCPKVLSFPFSSYCSTDEKLTFDYWGNVIFDYNDLPNVELNDNRNKYDIIHKDYSEALQKFNNPKEDSLLDELYSYTITIHHKLQNCPKVGKCFDENMYYYIQCIKHDKIHLTYVLSKMLGIWQQISSII